MYCNELLLDTDVVRSGHYTQHTKDFFDLKFAKVTTNTCFFQLRVTLMLVKSEPVRIYHSHTPSPGAVLALPHLPTAQAFPHQH